MSKAGRPKLGDKCLTVAERNRRYREKTELDYWAVYYLPHEHYCGISKNPVDRMRCHKARKLNTDDWRVLYCADTYEDAIVTETKFHLLGMNGHKELKHIKQ